MLDKRLKWAFLLATVFFAGIPLLGIYHEEIEGLFDKLAGGIRAGHQPDQDQGDQSGNPTNTVTSSSAPAASAEALKEDMVFIPAGEFLRGYHDGGFDEKPEGRIHLDAYWIDRYEVTYGAYMGFVAATKGPRPLNRYVKHFEKLSGATQPMVNVSWNEANAYCRYRGARLPTEAEWEKAARGTQGLLFPWGNEDKPGAANTGNPDSYEFTSPAGSFPLDKSPYGVYDMAGNAMEWVADWYQEDAYKEKGPNPQGPITGEFKAIRGSSWETDGKETRLTVRLKGKVEVLADLRDPSIGFNFRRETVGFRCARTAMAGQKPGAQKTTQLYNKSK
jgi:sulfatase modifying factor 1